jgi:hypothetical protein
MINLYSVLRGEMKDTKKGIEKGEDKNGEKRIG